MTLAANFNPDPWLNLGIAGAALFLIFVLMVLILSVQNKQIANLCEKIDVLVNSLSSNNTTLTEVIITNDKDQKQILLYLAAMQEDIKDIQRRVTRVDTRLYDKYKSICNEHKEDQDD